MGRRWRAAALALLVGCGRHGFGGDDDAGADAPGADAGGVADAPGADAGGCTAGTPADDFEAAGPPCGTWGFASRNGLTMARTRGDLVITPIGAPSPPDFAGCSLDNHTLVADAVVEVGAVLGGAGGYTNHKFYFAGGDAGVQVNGADGSIFAITDLGEGPHQPFDPIAMRYWRLRPEPTRLVVEVSAGDGAWTTLGSRDATGASLVGVLTFGAGRLASDATGEARFETFNICP
jgi:hypothetical protein